LRITAVQSQAFHIVLAICLVSGTWWASHPVLHPTSEVQENLAPPAAPTVEADAMDLRTGDTFWGIHLDGVVPCSSLVVKGGGNLVTLSAQHDHDARCVYQVVQEKRITLHGNEFLLRVVAPDQIHVERATVSKAVATNR
jgi:hypothetical protein